MFLSATAVSQLLAAGREVPLFGLLLATMLRDAIVAGALRTSEPLV